MSVPDKIISSSMMHELLHFYRCITRHGAYLLIPIKHLDRESLISFVWGRKAPYFFHIFYATAESMLQPIIPIFQIYIINVHKGENRSLYNVHR